MALEKESGLGKLGEVKRRVEDLWLEKEHQGEVSSQGKCIKDP